VNEQSKLVNCLIYRIAQHLNIKHQVILMVDWKDGREGVLTYDVVKYIETILNLSHIQLVGVSFNFMPKSLYIVSGSILEFPPDTIFMR
jgi:predicted amino acid racemase